MRLVSQDGMIDVPYENLTIAVDNDNDDGKVHILARGIVEYLSIIIAVYSNTDKALKVMEMLREQYMRNNALYIDRENNARVIPQNSLFKFPDDSDVEV